MWRLFKKGVQKRDDFIADTTDHPGSSLDYRLYGEVLIACQTHYLDSIDQARLYLETVVDDYWSLQIDEQEVAKPQNI